MNVDRSLLEAALAGYLKRRDEIDARIAEIRRQIGGSSVRVARRAAKKTSGTKRHLSPAARKRISEATKKRWAAFRAEKAKSGGK